MYHILVALNVCSAEFAYFLHVLIINMYSDFILAGQHSRSWAAA
jgi:hypothetical protein